MARDNPIQFAVVREDPVVELAAIDAAGAKSALLVASGGCTALTLAALRPAVALTLLDQNPAQLALVEKKLAALRAHAPGSAERARVFSCDGNDDPSALTACGNFESLFRGLRAVLDDLIVPAAERARLLAADPPALLARLCASRYWPVAFAMFFSDAMLEAMFGKDATQHATPGSYPGYFRAVVERGLARGDAAANPWLAHVLLGFYPDGAAPAYLAHDFTESPRFRAVHAAMHEAPRFDGFDVVSLSNLFDWMSADGVRAIATRLQAECRPGTRVLVRQLNNRAPVEDALAPAFRVDQELSRDLLSRDRSLFYERILVLERT